MGHRGVGDECGDSKHRRNVWLSGAGIKQLSRSLKSQTRDLQWLQGRDRRKVRNGSLAASKAQCKTLL